MFLQVLKLGHCLLILTLPSNTDSKCFPVKRILSFWHFSDFYIKLETCMRRVTPQTYFYYNLKWVKLNFETKIDMRQNLPFTWVDICITKIIQNITKTCDLTFIVKLLMRQVLLKLFQPKKFQHFLCVKNFVKCCKMKSIVHYF